MHDPVILPSHTMDRPFRGRLWILLAAIVLILLFSFSTLISWYVSGLWFGSLGFASVFWKSLRLQWAVFAIFGVVTFVILYGWCLLLVRVIARDLTTASTFRFADRQIHIPLDTMLRWGGLVLSALIALGSGAGLMANWPKIALWWYQPHVAGQATDPILGHPLGFYLFTLPVWQIVSGWFLTIAILMCVAAVFAVLVAGGSRLAPQGFDRSHFDHSSPDRPMLDRSVPLPWNVLSIPVALLLAAIAARVWIGRIELLITDHTVFSGVTYTDAHVFLRGMAIVCVLFLVGAAIACLNFVSRPRLRWVVLAPIPAIAAWVIVQLVGWYVASFIVKPNQLDRELPYITQNIEFTRRAFGLDRIAQHKFPADVELAAADPAHNQDTLQNVRLWDWRALQDTLRQLQEIRTYYDFPDIDIDRYTIGGQTRQVMLATRELSIDKLPESSRNWINEKLIYTHGYGITMNPVNGFTPEGLPTLLLSNMPIESAPGAPTVTRPEVYFGELTTTDVYVKTRQKEFNYPHGESNSVSSYEGNGGIPMGGLLRRLLISYDRGDLAKVPFSDDIGPDSRLLMRREIRARVRAIAPFLTFDSDPYIVVGDDGRLRWYIDAFTTSDTYPYATHYDLGDGQVNYIRNSVKVVVDAYNGDVTFYVFDPTDPIISAWRGVFPALFKDASAMPDGLRLHIRYPELLLAMQAEVYGLYHMTDPVVFYNREDLWTVASEISLGENGAQAAQPMDPNFVLMKLPENSGGLEFIDILAFTPANRNNLIGWIAGRSDGDHYGSAIAYDFPKTRLVDGPMQIEARIDQNAQLSGQLTLWNQQGSHVRRGTLLVIPCGKALLYAEPIYLQAQRSPMPELRLVVLALQDKLAYSTSYEGALQSLFAGVPSSLTGATPEQQNAQSSAPASAASGKTAAPDVNALIQGAARDIDDYQRLTAQGKLAEAGQKLEQLKRKLEQLNARQK